MEQLTDFEEAYVLGVAASKGLSSNYAVAIVALKKACRLNPRRKVRGRDRPRADREATGARLVYVEMAGSMYASSR